MSLYTRDLSTLNDADYHLGHTSPSSTKSMHEVVWFPSAPLPKPRPCCIAQWFGHYSWGHNGGKWTRNEVHDNHGYGFDPHDDSDNVEITGNTVYNNGWHGISKGATPFCLSPLALLALTIPRPLYILYIVIDTCEGGGASTIIFFRLSTWWRAPHPTQEQILMKRRWLPRTRPTV